MSASEKLKALEAAASDPPWSRVGLPFRRRPKGRILISDVDQDLVATVRNALPQIVALVEVAEQAGNSPGMETMDMIRLGSDGSLRMKINRALAELEKALS